MILKVGGGNIESGRGLISRTGLGLGFQNGVGLASERGQLSPEYVKTTVEGLDLLNKGAAFE